MSVYPNPYCPPTGRPAWLPQSTTSEPAVPSLSSIALQDIVEGQQLATNGLVSLLSQERTSNERGARDHKQQLANLTALSQNFLGFMPDVEQKFSALESSARNHGPGVNNAELQDRVKDMEQVVANLRRFAEGFACSTGLRLMPGLAPGMWAWVPSNISPLQQDHTSFSATFPQAPRIFPTTIPNSARSSVFAHSTGPGRSVHWPSDLDPPTTTWTQPWQDSYYVGPYDTCNAPAASSHASLGGMRGFPPGTGPGTACSIYPLPRIMTPTLSDTSSPWTPMTGQFRPRSPPSSAQAPFPPLSVPILEPSRGVRCTTLSTSTPSQTESVVGSLRRTPLSPITESLPSSTPRGPPLRSELECFSSPSVLNVGPSSVPRPSFVPSAGVPMDMLMYPTEASSNARSISVPSPERVSLPPLRPVETVHWSSLFPSAPVVVERPAPEGDSSCLTGVSSLDESNASPMLSPVRSVVSVSYCGSELSSPSEPMTPLSRMTGESPPGAVPNRLTTDVVDTQKESDDSVRSAAKATAASTTTAVASASNASSVSKLPRNHLDIQLVSFFYESVLRIFKIPSSVDLSYNGFEVSFSTASIPWNAADVSAVADEGGEPVRTFEIMPAPSNEALHRYVRGLERVRMDLAAMQGHEGESTDRAVEQLELRVRAEQEATQGWIKRVCAAAGTLSIVDRAFSPRK